VGDLRVDKDALESNKPSCEGIMAGETNVAATDVQLRSGLHKDLLVALDHYAAVFKPGRKPSSSSKPAAAAGASKPPPFKGNPIIVVPNALTAPVSMFNSREFFCDARYVTAAAAKKANGAAKPKIVTCERRLTKTGKAVTFEIIDTVQKLAPDDWRRVVAVVVQGKTWQFKGWKTDQGKKGKNKEVLLEKFEEPVSTRTTRTTPLPLRSPNSTQVEIFGRHFGFYIGLEGDPIPDTIKAWAVKQGKINRDKRGLDAVTQTQFWQNLEEWLYLYKPGLGSA
jgi:parafibromin